MKNSFFPFAGFTMNLAGSTGSGGFRRGLIVLTLVVLFSLSPSFMLECAYGAEPRLEPGTTNSVNSNSVNSARPPKLPQKCSRLEGVVNLNQATEKQLVLLPGVGKKTARAIVEYRKKRKFRKVRHLRRIRGIGRKRMRRLRPLLALSGSTSIRELKCRPRASGESPKKMGGI